MGDEVRRTQRGNNNAYCQDNDISWFDWTLLDRHPGVHRFVKALIAFRQRRDVVVGRVRLSLNEMLSRSRIDWHGVALGHPDWSDQSHSLALDLTSFAGHARLHVMLNAYWEPLRFQLPLASPENGGAWRRWIDTSLPSPHDIVAWGLGPEIAEASYLVQARSVALLVMPLAQERGRDGWHTPTEVKVS